MDAFGVFKIVMGIIISIFILIMVYNFAISYMGVNEKKKTAVVLNDFERGIRDVHVNSIPGNFSFENDIYESLIMYRPPFLITRMGNIDFGYVPLFMDIGRKVSISRVSYNLGWWEFNYVTVLPKKKIIYIITDDSPLVWETMRLITMSFPNTESVEPDVTFGFGCNETFIFKLNKWKRDVFYQNMGVQDNIEFVKQMIDYETECSGYLEDDEIPVFLTLEDIDTDEGIVITPVTEEWGYIKTQEGDELIYKDGMDIMAFIIGGNSMYEYKNKIYLNQLRVASKVKYDEIELLKLKTSKNDCINLYDSIQPILNYIYSFSDSDINDKAEIMTLINNLEQSRQISTAMEEKGCD